MSLIETGSPHLNGIVQEGNMFFQKKDSLPPEILNTIYTEIKRFPNVIIDWGTPTVSSAEKFALLQGSTSFELLDQSELPPQLKPLRQTYIKPYVMQTVTFTVEGQSGLVTAGFDQPNQRLSSEDEKLIKQRLGVKSSSKMQLGIYSDINIGDLGFAPGYVGPWLPGNKELHNLFIAPEFTSEDPNVFPIFDIALGNCESALLFHPAHPQALSKLVAQQLNGALPVTMHRKEVGTAKY